LKAALLGLLQSGKSTILSAISGKALPAVGSTAIAEAIVPVPDERLDWLTEYHKPKKTTYATIDCLDLPGFNFADEHGRAAARRLISQIRTVDMLVLVVRAFESQAVAPYRNSVNPARDLVELRTELLLADLELVTTRIERLEKQIHKPTKTQAHDKAELALQKKLQEFMADLGITESAAGKFVRGCYSALGLISFLTVVSGELRAWPIKQGTAALDAAGKVHTDIKRGFIRAETFSFDDLKEVGSEKALKAAGKIRLEGKDYIVQDGDVINFRFNV